MLSRFGVATDSTSDWATDMTNKWISGLLAIGLASSTAASSQRAPDTTIDRMPAALETQFALSAAPPRLRDQATVYLLDPATGYRLSKKGTSGVTCIVERTAWELADFRNDIYIPLCYDAVGTATYLKVMMDAAALRARGMGAVALKAEIERRYKGKTYRAPAKAGVSYMVAPVFRTIGPPDMKVHTMAMSHFMPYAPYTTNADIGARPDLADPASLKHPFIDRQGNDEQSYVIQMVGDAEQAKILTDEKALVDALCAYRSLLCLGEGKH
jgi:hypothetical protein